MAASGIALALTLRQVARRARKAHVRRFTDARLAQRAPARDLARTSALSFPDVAHARRALCGASSSAPRVTGGVADAVSRAPPPSRVRVVAPTHPDHISPGTPEGAREQEAPAGAAQVDR